MASPSRPVSDPVPTQSRDTRSRRRATLLASMEAVLGRPAFGDTEAATFDALKAEVEQIDRALETTQQRSPIMTDRSGVVSIRAPISAPAVHVRSAHLADGSGAEDYHFGAALAVLLEERNPGVDVGFAKEVSQELERRTPGGPKRNGLLVPANAMLGGLLGRQIGTKPGDAGAALTTVDYRADLFELDVAALRAALIAGRVGARILTSSDPEMIVPRQDQPLPLPVTIARDGTATVQTSLHTRALHMVPHTMAAYQQLYRSARLYGDPQIYGLVLGQMGEGLAYKADQLWLYGNSVTTPTDPDGLIRQPVQTYNFGSAGAAGRVTPLKLDAMRSMIALQPLNVPRMWLMSTLAEGTLATTWSTAIDPLTGVETTSTYGPPILAASAMGGLLAGYPYVTAPQIEIQAMGAAKASDLWLGHWPSSGIVYFGPSVELVPNIYGATYTSGGIEVIGFQDLDCFCLDPARFVLATDLQLNQSTAPIIVP
jgi:hypothetical protein